MDWEWSLRQCSIVQLSTEALELEWDGKAFARIEISGDKILSLETRNIKDAAVMT